MRIKGQHVLPKVLTTLQNVGVAMFTSGGHSSSTAYRTFRTFDRLQAISDKQLRQTVDYAINKKYIRVTHRDGKHYLELTKAGKHVADKAALEELRPLIQKVWDCKWRVVLFDIPETEKKSRDGFAANLKRLGFVQIQKSAFTFPYPCFEEVEVLADFHQVTPYLTCITAESLAPSKELQRRFKL